MKLLERFGMVECKSVTSLMELNLKKLCGSVVGPDLGNPSEYHQLIGALMFLVNSRPDNMFCSEHIESVYGRASSYTLDFYQESLEISPGHNHL